MRRRAMHSRCCWPPEKASAEASSRSFVSSQRFARCRERERVESNVAMSVITCQARPKEDILLDRSGKGFGFWNTIPTWKRRASSDQVGS